MANGTYNRRRGAGDNNLLKVGAERTLFVLTKSGGSTVGQLNNVEIFELIPSYITMVIEGKDTITALYLLTGSTGTIDFTENGSVAIYYNVCATINSIAITSTIYVAGNCAPIKLNQGSILNHRGTCIVLTATVN